MSETLGSVRASRRNAGLAELGGTSWVLQFRSFGRRIKSGGLAWATLQDVASKYKHTRKLSPDLVQGSVCYFLNVKVFKTLNKTISQRGIVQNYYFFQESKSSSEHLPLIVS